MESFKKWDSNYFASKARYKSKVIVEMQEAKVNPMPFSPRRTPDASKFDCEDTKNQHGTPVGTEEHQSIVSPRTGDEKFKIDPPTLTAQKDNKKDCCSQMYCVPCIVAKEKKILSED